MQYTQLTASAHGHLRRKQGTFFHLNTQPLVQISVVEASAAALDTPLVFVRGTGGELRLMVLLSLDANDNAHVGPKGYWMGGYMPVLVQACPFALAESGDQMILAVQEESDWLSSEEGVPLFTDQGDPSEAMEQIIEMLKAGVPSAQRDGAALTAIAQAQLLEPWSEVSSDMLRVDLARLNNLDNDAFLALREGNALPLVYAHLMSLRRINRIRRLAEKKRKMMQRLSTVHAGSDGENLNFNFEDDTIKFGF